MEHHQVLDSDSEDAGDDELFAAAEDDEEDSPDSDLPAMERQMKLQDLRRQAYYAVLRTFKAESRALSTERILLIRDLMSELKITFIEHKNYMDVINKDKFIRDIRGDSGQEEEQISAQPSKTSKPLRMVLRTKKKTLESHEEKHTPRPPAVGISFGNSWGKASPESLLERRVHIRLPGDDDFNEFVIKKYNKDEGLHYLECENDTMDDPCSWIDLREIPIQDIMWEGEDPGISRKQFSHKPGKTVLRATSTSRIKRGTDDALFKVPPLPSRGVTAEKPLKEADNVAGETSADEYELKKTKKSRHEPEQAQGAERTGRFASR